jgi:hypothetical protein
MAAWTATSNIWRGISSRIFACHIAAAATARRRTVHDHRQRIDLVAVDQQVELDDIGGAVFLEFVVDRGIAARDDFSLSKKSITISFIGSS